MNKLNQQQNYLLSRLPRQYDVTPLEVPEPAEVKAAKKIIERHEKHASDLRCEHQKKYKKALEAAREAIYFKKPEEALAAVRSLEAQFHTKCSC